MLSHSAIFIYVRILQHQIHTVFSFVVSHQVGNDRQNTSKENSVVKLNDTEKWLKNVDKNVLQNIYYWLQPRKIT